MTSRESLRDGTGTVATGNFGASGASRSLSLFPSTPAREGSQCRRTSAPLKTSKIPRTAMSLEMPALADVQPRELSRVQ